MSSFSKPPLVFGGAERETSPFVIVGVPLDMSASYRPGSREGPYAIRKVSEEMEFWSELAWVDMDEYLYRDWGDVPITYDSLESNLKRIESVVGSIDGIPVLLGGEHTITYPAVKALKPQCLLVMDAHLDFRDELKGGKLTHGTWLRRLMEDMPNLNAAVYGARAFAKEELEEVRKFGVFVSKEETAIEEWAVDCKYIYISIDMDVFDPAYAPGVGNPEPHGKSPSQVLKVLQAVLSRADMVGMDVVEVTPSYDVTLRTALLAAKMIIEATALQLIKSL